MRYISDEIANDMLEAIQMLMDNWSPDPQNADYRCEFCGERPPTNAGRIIHRKNCDGVRFKEALLRSESPDLTREKE